jgi:hypothetical protein
MANTVGGGQDYINGYGYAYKPGGVDYYSYNTKTGAKTPITREIFQSNTSQYGANVGQIEAGAPRSSVNAGQSQTQAAINSINATLAGLGGPSAYVAPPKYDVNKAYSTARTQATATANAYFTTEVNKYLTYMNQIKDLRKQEYNLDYENIGRVYREYMGQAETNKQRTGEDFTTNMGQMADSEALRQKAESRQADANQRGLESQLGASGLSYSGLGEQALMENAAQRGDVEQGARQDLDAKKQQQVVYKTRTLEDIASGIESKTADKTYQEQSAKLDLDTFMADKEREIFEYKQNKEIERQNQIYRDTESIYRTNTISWLNNIKNAQVREKGYQTYL